MISIWFKGGGQTRKKFPRENGACIPGCEREGSPASEGDLKLHFKQQTLGQPEKILDAMRDNFGTEKAKHESEGGSKLAGKEKHATIHARSDIRGRGGASHWTKIGGRADVGVKRA